MCVDAFVSQTKNRAPIDANISRRRNLDKIKQFEEEQRNKDERYVVIRRILLELATYLFLFVFFPVEVRNLFVNL